MSPEGSNLVLSSDVPHGKRDVLVLDRLDIEACCEPKCKLNSVRTNSRDSRHNLSEFELVKDGGFTSSIQSNHENTYNGEHTRRQGDQRISFLPKRP